MIVWGIKNKQDEYYAGDGEVDTRIEAAITMNKEAAEETCILFNPYFEFEFKPIKIEIKEVE